jgi:hypothetical protein
MGGLGNQLFQIFTTISSAINTRRKFTFIDIDKLGSGETTVRPTYWNNFLSKLKIFTTKSFPQMLVIKESNYRYNPINLFMNQDKNICIYGYFQSYKYFDNNFEFICRLIGIDEIKKNVITKTNISEGYLNNAISIHFRIGDYKKIQHYHPIMTLEYYLNALSLITNIINENEIKNVLYFCEEEDLLDVSEIINKLKNRYPNFTFIKASNTLSDWEQMTLMSCCKHNIIANSSFSWWGAHFNTNPDKIVCYPAVWFGEVAGHDTRDLCPPGWHKIHVL